MRNSDQGISNTEVEMFPRHENGPFVKGSIHRKYRIPGSILVIEEHL